jgi:hypothetical protein
MCTRFEFLNTWGGEKVNGRETVGRDNDRDVELANAVRAVDDSSPRRLAATVTGFMLMVCLNIGRDSTWRLACPREIGVVVTVVLVESP